MILPWSPVVLADILGSVLVLWSAFYSVALARQWTLKKTDNVFRNYIFLLTLAIAFFAVSRSFGHLVKQILLAAEMTSVWKQMAPFSGAINTAAFIVIFAFGIYFHRFQKVHTDLENYKNNLEEQIAVRTLELEDSRRLLETILNSTNPICITDLDYNILQSNDSYDAIWPGADSDQDENKCYQYRPSAKCHTDLCPIRQIVSGLENYSHEETIDIDGRKRAFIVTARPLLNTAGELVGVVESFQEISDRKQAELKLAKEREQLLVTLRSIGDGVITTDLDGRVMMINKVAEQLTGWDESAAFGKPIQQVFAITNEKDNAPARNPVFAAIRSLQICELDHNTILHSREGRRYNVEDSAAPIFDQSGKIIGSILVFRDISEKRKTEEELQKVKKLESVGILAGGIAHDFNNILAAIMGNINLALRDPGISDKVDRLLNQAQNASNRARDLTQQLLTFAKGGQPIRATASLAEVVRESADFVLRGSKSVCHYDLPDDLWLADIDTGQISQVVQNLILNASDAMPEGGTIEVSARNVSAGEVEGLPLSSDHDYILLQVADSGCGIAAEKLEKIFDPYFSTKPQGSGLGLAITHSIITKHDGYVLAESVPGQGTTFRIYLPAASGPLKEAEPYQIPCPIGRSARILIMDDEKMVRDIVQEMLVEIGHEVLLAKDGEEALRSYQQADKSGNKVDLVIMDLTVPGGMGGKEAVQKLLEIDPQAKVVVASGYSNDPVMANYTDYGFSAALAKPYHLEDIERILCPLLASHPSD